MMDNYEKNFVYKFFLFDILQQYNMPKELKISVQQDFVERPWWTSLYHLSLYQIFKTSWQPCREESHYFCVLMFIDNLKTVKTFNSLLIFCDITFDCLLHCMCTCFFLHFVFAFLFETTYCICARIADLLKAVQVQSSQHQHQHLSQHQ